MLLLLLFTETQAFFLHEKWKNYGFEAFLFDNRINSLLNMDVYMNDPKYVLVDSVDFVTNKTHIFVSLFF